MLAVEPERILTVGDCSENYSRYCEKQGFTPTERRSFTGLMAEGIRERFDLGLRNDLRGADGKYHRGWKGLTCQIPTVADAPDLAVVGVSQN